MKLELVQDSLRTMPLYSLKVDKKIREHYNEQTRTERFKVSEFLFGSKTEEGTSLVDLRCSS